MQTVPLDNIARLDNDAFLHILQSILLSHKGKYTTHAHSWISAQDFAKQSFANTHCTEQDVHEICATFANMFNLKHVIPQQNESFGNFTEDMYKTWRSTRENITFFTSGSTGKPKPCTHPESHLRQELMGIIPLIQNRKRALVTSPLHHLYGFTFGLLLPLSLGIPIRLEAPMPTAIAHQIKQQDLVIGVPLLYGHMARLENIESRQSFLMTGTAPMPAEVFEQLLSLGFKMIECFGSSEMGVMCCRLSPKIHFSLLPQFTRLKQTDEQNSSDIVQRTLPDNSVQNFTLQDNIDWKDDRHLLPMGRKDFAVQVAGVNVFPEYVEKILNAHEAINACSVRLMRPEEGYQLKAFIILERGYDENIMRKELRNYVKQNLKIEEQPARFDFGTDLPRSSIGKPADW